MDEVWKQIVPKLPMWAIWLFALAVFGGIGYRIFTSDDIEIIGFKLRRDKALRELLRRTEQEVVTLSALVPLINLLHGELADLFSELDSNPSGVPERISNLYQAVLAGLTQVVRAKGYHRAAILFPEADGNNPVLGVSWTHSYSTEAKHHLKFDLSSIPGRVYSSGEYYYCRDTSQDKRFSPNPKSTHTYNSILCVPIGTHQKTIGVLQIDAVPTNAFSMDDINTLHAFARYIAVLRYVQHLLHCEIEEVAPGEDPNRTAD